MRTNILTPLDAGDLDAREEYERMFYEAFARVPSNQLVRQLWIWDDEHRRLKTRLAYEEQKIWISRRIDGTPHIAIATNDDPARAQSAAYGFAIPHTPAIFEVLTFFAAGALTFSELRSFWGDFVARMRDAGKTTGYATSATPMLPMYKRAGWEIVEATEIAGEARYFLRLCLDSRPAQTLLRGYESECAASRRFVAELASGGDSRLDLDPTSGRNLYGCRPTPDAAEVNFGATTASTISPEAFEEARACFERLALNNVDARRGAVTAEAEAIACEIAEFASLPGARVWLTPSGTDAAMLATYAIASRASTPLTTIIVGIEETGSGVGHAVVGRHFQPRTPQGMEATPGEQIAPGRDFARIETPLRDDDGAPLGLAQIDAAVQAAVRRELAAGRRVLIHRLDSSKTGLTAPSLCCLDALQAAHGENVEVLVDSCQMRASTASLLGYHRRNWLILITGSKWIGGPPFSGAVIVPASVAAKAPHLPGYDHPDAPATGVVLRWRAALTEWRGFASIPEQRKAAIAKIFADVARRTLGERKNLRAIDGAPGDRAAPGAWDAIPTIFAFAVLRADGEPLGMEALRALFLNLLKARGARPAIRIGQPVKLGAGAALRLSLDARQICNLAQCDNAAANIEKRLLLLFDQIDASLLQGAFAQPV